MVARVVFLGAVFFGFELIFLSYVVFLYHPSTTTTPGMIFYPRWKSTDTVNCSGPIATNVSESTQSLMVDDDTTNEDDSDVWFSTFLLILVPIRPSDIYARHLIRTTWFENFDNSTEDVVLRYAVGNRTMDADKRFELTEENGTYGDIIFVDSAEDVAALTNKTLALLKWANSHVNFSYFMKCDDDTYVFIDNMLDELRKRQTTTKLYFGKFLENGPIVRGNYKWADNDWDLGPVYLPFAMGGGYILSHDLVAALSENSHRLKWHINEDTAIGSWLSAFDYERRSDFRFCFLYKGHVKSLEECTAPYLAILLFGFSREELKMHFNHYHEQVNANENVTILTPPTEPPTKPAPTRRTHSRPRPTRKTVRIPTTKTTEGSTTKSTEKSTEKSTAKSTEKSTEKSTKKSTEKPKKSDASPQTFEEIPTNSLR